MRTVILAAILAVLFHVAGRRFWCWWSCGAGELPADLVRRSQ